MVASGCVAPPKKVVTLKPPGTQQAKRPTAPEPMLGPLPPASDKIVKASTFTAYVPRDGEVPGVVGMLGRYKVSAGQNLLDIAREGGLGFRELREANPRSRSGSRTPASSSPMPPRRILPRPTRWEGLVINIPEFQLVDRRYPGEFVYQPVKVGERKGRVFGAVHQDVYEVFENLQAHAESVVARTHLDQRIDPDRLAIAVKQQRGVPIDVTRGEAQAADDAGDDKVAAGG